MDPNWQKAFFTGMALDLWRQAVSAAQTEQEADFIESALGRRPGARWLDVPCGNGRHALALARRGIHLTGLDLAEDFLAEAREASAAAGVEVEWICADMRQMDRVESFDGAFCFGNSFGYFPYADMLAFVAGVARALRPGARFVVQSFMTAESILPAKPDRETHHIGDIAFTIDNRYLAAESCLETACTFVRGTERETKTFWHWVYTAGELRRLFAAAGLTTIDLLSTFDRQPYALGSPQLLLIAEKR